MTDILKLTSPKLASQSDVTYDRFLSHVTCLCDTLYSEGESEKSRTEYQIEDIDITKFLIPEEGSGDEDSVENENFDFSDLIGDHSVSMHFGSVDASVEEFVMEADAILDNSQYVTTSYRADILLTVLSFTNPKSTPMTSTPLARSQSNPNPTTNPFCQSRFPTPSPSAMPASSPFPPPTTSSAIFTSHSSSATPSASTSSTAEQNKYKCYCGYIPRGEEKWKASNLARHKRTQHPVEVKVYKCGFPGCSSTFTRSDNLRSHARDKGHEMKGDDVRWGGFGEDGEGKRDREREREDWEGKRRPSKRRKVIASSELKDDSTDCGKWLDSPERVDGLDPDIEVLHTRIVPY